MSAPKLPPEAAGWDLVSAPKRDENRNLIRPVTVQARGKGPRGPLLTITINPAGFPENHLPPWLKRGGKIFVMRGRGEFLGTLRLLPGGDTPIKRAGRSTAALLINIKPLEGHPEQGAPRTDVPHDYSDTWFDIMLPIWHGPHDAEDTTRLKTEVLAATKNLVEGIAKVAADLGKPAAKTFTLAAGAVSHPGWVSPKAADQHRLAVEKGGGA